MPTEQLQQHCRDFVQQELLPALYPPVLERLRAHQQAGDDTVLCSASPDWWTRHVGAALGFTLAMVLFACIREKLALAKMPKWMDGFPGALITAGLMAVAFQGFGGLI